nr:integrase, catalytic region, zinc finger, CCHC-type, peptidase aspartic, catalytic [Tanacetum cinerariifolium]
HLKEKVSLKQTVTLLKNDFQKEESRNIDRELALEKQVKELNNIVFKRNQSAQTVHMLTKPQFFCDHTTRQALGFQNPCYLKKAQQLEPKLYDGSVIQKTNAIVIHDSEETLMLEEESRSKMLMSEKKVNTKPVDYAALNQLSQDFETRFVPQTELPTQVEVPKELPKFSMVNSSLKKLKYHLASFNVVVKERTTATAITEGTWGFEHIKACFKDEINPFGAEQHRVESNRFQDKMKEVLNENERLLEQEISKDIVNIVVTANVNHTYEPVNECERCVTLETELQKDFIKKECYDKFLQEKAFIITSLKDTLRKLKGKVVVDEVVPLHPIDPELVKIDVAPLATKLQNNRKAHNDYLKHTQEETTTLKEIVKNDRLLNPLNTSLDYAYLEVAFHQHTCFIRNLEGVDLLTETQGNNLYTLSLGDIMASSPICLLSKASKTKSWLWHRCLSHLNFGAINHLAKQGLVRGLPKLKFEKDHLCSACAMGKSKKKSHKPKSEDTNQEKLYILHMDLCGPMRVESVNGKKRVVETIHVDFDELTAIASEQSSSRPALHEMTPATISSRLVPKLTSSTPFVPPSRNEWDLLFQPLLDELLAPTPSVDPLAPEVIAPHAEVIPPKQAESTGSPSSTIVDQDAPSPSKSQTTPET